MRHDHSSETGGFVIKRPRPVDDLVCFGTQICIATENRPNGSDLDRSAATKDDAGSRPTSKILRLPFTGMSTDAFGTSSKTTCSYHRSQGPNTCAFMKYVLLGSPVDFSDFDLPSSCRPAPIAKPCPWEDDQVVRQRRRDAARSTTIQSQSSSIDAVLPICAIA
jgi:hypothetical protein